MCSCGSNVAEVYFRLVMTAPSFRSSSAFRSLMTAATAMALAVGLGACDGDKAASDAANTPTTAKDEAPAEGAGEEKIAGKPVEGDAGAVAAKPGKKDEDTYTVVIEPPASVPAGSDAMVTVKVVPQGKWHMNLDYPTSLTVSASEGAGLTKEKLVKADALKLDDNSCEFGVGFTPTSAGEKTFKGKLKFAVCQDDACAPKSEEIEFAVAVN